MYDQIEPSLEIPGVILDHAPKQRPPEKIEKSFKLCPFKNPAQGDPHCDSRCTLYREKTRAGYECLLHELGTHSYVLRGIWDKIKSSYNG